MGTARAARLAVLTGCRDCHLLRAWLTHVPGRSTTACGGREKIIDEPSNRLPEQKGCMFPLALASLDAAMREPVRQGE